MTSQSQLAQLPVLSKRGGAFVTPAVLQTPGKPAQVQPMPKTSQRLRTIRMAAAQRSSSSKIHIANMPASPNPQTSYLDARKAAKIDEVLMSPRYAHTLVQLMELAGLSVAHAVCDYTQLPTRSRVTVVCGPGNNGGDGLVAARHLCHFGYAVRVWYPKAVEREPFAGLLTQLQALDVEMVNGVPEDTTLIVDAVFGFSFSGEHGVRAPFQHVIAEMNKHDAPILAVDVPSGWHVDKGNVYDCAVRQPEALISLTAPKLFARQLENSDALVHYVGGRFVPQRLCSEFGFDVPFYCGTDLIARIN